jgi:cytosine/adenosine deaminase-related metal-dependent hydrolase
MIESTGACLEKTEGLFERYLGQHKGKLTLSASFRGMNNASDELIVGLKEIANKHKVKLQTHACFSYQTHDASVSGTGKAEIERLESLGVLDENMILVHSGWLEPQELALLVKRKPTLVCSPSSSLHNGYGYMAAGKHPELMAMGVNVSLGSDHASSGVVDMVQEMRMAACMYKEVRMNPRVMPPEHAVEMATLNGAKGVGLQDHIGSIEVGKQADFVLFDATLPEWQCHSATHQRLWGSATHWHSAGDSRSHSTWHVGNFPLSFWQNAAPFFHAPASSGPSHGAGILGGACCR